MKTSESIKTITEALVKFQSELVDPAKSAINPAFKSKYIPLDDIILSVRPVANKFGLVFMQEVGGDGKTISVATRVSHISGEWMESEAISLAPDKPTPQAAMSFLTYMKRYSLSAFVLLASGDPDDDGNEATKHKKEKIEENRPVEQWSETEVTNYAFDQALFNKLTVKKCYDAGKDKGTEWLLLVEKEPMSSRIDRDVAYRARTLLALS